MFSTLKTLEKNGILKQTDGEKFRLRRPLKIRFPENSLAELKRIYEPNRERGGLFEFIPVVGEIVAVAFHEVPNTKNNSTSYNPAQAFWNARVEEILERGNLPLAVHTHPTHIGFDPYDNKRIRFYLKSSKPDRVIAGEGITPELLMPEAIFVKDTRFASGFGVGLFEGRIFPYSVTALSDAQIVATAAVLIALAFNKLSRRLLVVAAAWFLFEFYRRPRYQYGPDGLTVELTFVLS